MNNCSVIQSLSTSPQPQRTISCYSLQAKLESLSQYPVFDCRHTSSGLKYSSTMLLIREYIELAPILNCLQSLDCPFLSSIVDIRTTRNSVYVIEEKTQGWSLRQMVEKGQVSPRIAKRFLWEILTGLAELHKAGIVHGCLTPDNILLVKSQCGVHVKLTNYKVMIGDSAPISPQSKYYQAPEVLAGAAVSPASEVYAAGCIAAFLFSGVDPYSPKHCSFAEQSVLQLISAMTGFRKEKRVTAAEAVVFSIFDGQQEGVLKAVAEQEHPIFEDSSAEDLPAIAEG